MTLRSKLLGRSGLRVSSVALGTINFGKAWRWGIDEDACEDLFRAYTEAGGYFIDTAHVYTGGESERIVGNLIKADRDRWVLSTKFGLNDRAGDPNAGGGHRKAIVRQLEDSLRRLRTDYIDLYWLHWWDALTPYEELVHALDDLRAAGKILYAGMSNTPAWFVAQASAAWDGLVAIQVPYNLVDREAERELFPMARGCGLSACTWSPLSAGLLTGRFGTDRDPPEGTRIMNSPYAESLLNDRNLAIADVLNRVADKRGVPVYQVALAWVMAQQQRAPIIPILGASSPAQLHATLDGLTVDLTNIEVCTLDQVSHIPAGYPYRADSPLTPYGDTLELLDTEKVVPR